MNIIFIRHLVVDEFDAIDFKCPPVIVYLHKDIFKKNFLNITKT